MVFIVSILSNKSSVAWASYVSKVKASLHTFNVVVDTNVMSQFRINNMPVLAIVQFKTYFLASPLANWKEKPLFLPRNN